MDPKPTIVVLAGGLATRLGGLTKSAPKSLVDVNGRPFLAYQLELFASAGLDDVVFCIGHYGDQIQHWVAANAPVGMRVRFSHDGPGQRGTGGALLKALPLLGEVFLVTYGDSYLRCDYIEVYRHFLQAHESNSPERRPLGLMAVYENRDQYDASNVIFHGGRIVRYDKTNRVPEMRHIDWGLSVLTREAFTPFPPAEPLDLASVFETLVHDARLLGLEVSERFYEVGSIAGLGEFRTFLAPGGSADSSLRS